MFHNAYNIIAMQTPTRVRRGLAVPEIDTKQPIDHGASHAGLPIARTYGGLPTPPQSAHESRRTSFQYSAIQEAPFSATSSSFAYSQPATPIHNIQSIDACAHVWSEKDLSHTGTVDISMSQISDQRLQTELQNHTKCTLQQLAFAGPFSPPPNTSTVDMFGVPVTCDVSTPQIWQSSHHITNELPGHATCLGSALFPMVHDDVVGGTSASTYDSLNSSVHGVNSGFDATSTNGLQEYGVSNVFFQHPQVVVPSQLTPQEDFPSLNWSEYAKPDSEGDGLSNSFSSSVGTVGSFDFVRPTSPMDAYMTQSDDDEYFLINGEEFQSHDDSSILYYPPPNFANLPSRARKRSSKRLRQAGKGNCWHKQYRNGVEVHCEGKQFRLDGPVRYETGDQGKAHRCQYIEENGKRCDARFERTEHLKRHMGKHSPARPFLCPIQNCKTPGIQRSDNAKDHFKTHLKPKKKGKRNEHVEWPVLQRAICDTYEDKKVARKLLDNLRKWYESGMPEAPSANSGQRST